MLTTEMVFARGLLREFFKEMGYRTMNKVAPDLVSVAFELEAAESYMKGHNLGPEDGREEVAMSALRVLHSHKVSLLDYLRRNGHVAMADYLESLFALYLAPSGEAERPAIAQEIFHHWNDHHWAGSAQLQSGIYQIFRRFKPRNPNGPERDNIAKPDADDILIVELLYLDAARMECFIVTSEGNIFWGTAHLNDDATLAIIMQRSSRRSEANLRHRFLALHARHEEGDTPSIYSGVYMKAGDKTKRPLAGEAIFRLIEREAHDALYTRMEEIFHEPYSYHIAREDSLILPYIASYDGVAAQARVGDLPFIEQLTQPDSTGIVLFREPIRTTDAEALVRLNGSGAGQFDVYRREPVDPAAGTQSQGT